MALATTLATAFRGKSERPVAPSEIAVDGVVHVVGLVGAVAAVITLFVIVAIDGAWMAIAPLAAYSAGLLAMFGFSAAYNMTTPSRHSATLQRLDHAAIFVMIAGTYTPFTTLGLEGMWAVGMTAAVWAIALVGIGMKLFLPPGKFPVVSTLLYIAFGWVGLIAVRPLLEALSVPVLILLAIGGGLYTIGTLFHGLRRMPYQNAVWHGFVLAAAAVHFTAVLLLVNSQ